jgi:GTP cyclohydrolase II
MSVRPLDTWCVLPTAFGDFRMHDAQNDAVRVLGLGDLEGGDAPLVRIHSSCVASEVFGARDCDCADQLRESMKRIAMEGRGLVVHLQQEGRGHGLSLKIRAVSEMQRRGLDTVAAFDALGAELDSRTYEEAVRVLRHFGLESVRLLTNNPRKAAYLEEAGFRVEVVHTHPTIRPENEAYLVTKNRKLGHRIPLDETDDPSALVRFYHSDQPWGAFSNFSPHAVFVHGRVWPTVEHFYQGQKFAGTAHEEAIRTADTPMLAKRLAEDLTREHRRDDWSKHKLQVMLWGLRAKFRQHPDLGALLLRTGERALVEHTRNDAYWGDGGDGHGQNWLGRLLMTVRAELRAAGSDPGSGTDGTSGTSGKEG